MGEPENLKLIYLILNLYMGSFSTYEEEIESVRESYSCWFTVRYFGCGEV